MLDHDIVAIENALKVWKDKLGEIKTVALFSPERCEKSLVSNLFPDAVIKEYGKSYWDLDFPCPDTDIVYDLALICNTFLCSQNPSAWFTNIQAVAKNLVVQDIIRGWRGGDRETIPDTGDYMRYSIPPNHIARLENAFDLTTLGTLQEYVTYSGFDGINKLTNEKMDSLLFVGWFKKPEEAIDVVTAKVPSMAKTSKKKR